MKLRFVEHACFRPLSAEFPNDNPELHLGAIWTCPHVCGPAEAEVGPLLEELAHEPEALHIDTLPALTPGRLKQGVV